MKTEERVDDLTDLEFAKPCSSPKCDREATWMGHSTHGARACPAVSYICDPCKERITRMWEAVLRNGDICFRCNVPFAGQVSDNLRFIPL